MVLLILTTLKDTNMDKIMIVRNKESINPPSFSWAIANIKSNESGQMTELLQEHKIFLHCHWCSV
jgi:hypothetical protein